MSARKATIKKTFLGFGEASMAFVQGWQASPTNTNAFDIKTTNAVTRPEKILDYQRSNVMGHDNLADALAEADVIFSMVTVDQAATVALDTARSISKGQFYFDCNSCAPETKKSNSHVIEKAGGQYVDVAIMSPVHPDLHQTPLLISGPHCNKAMEVLSALDMKATIISPIVGQASSIKMIRSIMVKGLEALNAECLLAARKAGVDKTILASLDKSFPSFGWHDRSAYMLKRMMVHGVRRAAEMREVAATVEQLGLHNGMIKATIEWQQTIGDLAIAPSDENFDQLADSILQRLPN